MPDIRPHYFIGVPIPEGIANPIYQAAKNEPILTFQKWVHPLDYHITLIFLGAADETQIKKLEGSLAEIASEIDPFSIKFGKIDVFGDRRKPRVLHLEPKKTKRLIDCGNIRSRLYFRPAFKWKKTVSSSYDAGKKMDRRRWISSSCSV